MIALTSTGEAEQTLREALPGTCRGVVYADLNTSSAGLKLMLADIAATAGLRFADVALMSAVPGNGLRTPMLACGQGAAEYADVFRRFGASVEVLPGPVGAAVTRKLVRSVFYKGLAAAVTEALRAGRAAGCQEWIPREHPDEIESATSRTVDRLERGSQEHARRRADEMAAASELLDELGVPARVARASQEWLTQLADEARP